MVIFSGWELEEPSVADTAKFDMLIPTVVRPKAAAALKTSADLPHEVGIIRQFTFSSALARMSVITRKGFIFVQHLRGFLGQLCHLEICFLSKL